MPASEASDETIELLLQAATAVFAEQGYQQARVRQIAERAGTNVASISYHFGGKQALYLEVLRREAGRLVSRFPLRSGEPSDPETELRRMVGSLLSRFMASDESSIAPRLLLRELTNPTEALDQLLNDYTRPQLAQIVAVVARFLGPSATPEMLRRAALSVVGQCLFYLVARPFIGRIAPSEYEAANLAALADHITGFSIAGLKAARLSIEPRP